MTAPLPLEPSADAQPPELDLAMVARALSGPASRLVAEMRLEQIVKHGHDAENDAMLSIDRLPRVAHERLIRVLDHIRGEGPNRNLPAARRDLGRIAAICMAAIDRLDLAMKTEDE